MCIAKQVELILLGDDLIKPSKQVFRTKQNNSWRRKLSRPPVSNEPPVAQAAKAQDRTTALTTNDTTTRSTKERILDIIAQEGLIPRENLTDDATISSLGLKSMDIVMIITAIESEFDVYLNMEQEIDESIDIKSLVAKLETDIANSANSGK
jgi:acyl carrier protein